MALRAPSSTVVSYRTDPVCPPSGQAAASASARGEGGRAERVEVDDLHAGDLRARGADAAPGLQRRDGLWRTLGLDGDRTVPLVASEARDAQASRLPLR